MDGCHVKPEQIFNLIWGYNDQYFEVVSDLTADAGTNILLGTQVPDDELWVVTSVATYNNTNKPGASMVGVLKGGDYNVLNSDAPSAKSVAVTWSGLATMVKDDRAFAILTGCTANDDIYLYAHGYKMKLAQ